MSTLGALLMLIGSAAFTAAIIAGLWSLFGIWAAVAMASLAIVGIGGFLIRLGGDL